MHLTLIRQRYNPYGGAERFLSRALGALDNADIKVSLLARDWEPIKGIDFILCNPFYLGRLWRDWSFARKACRQIKTLKPDLVQSHERVACCDIYRAGDGVHRVWLEQKARNQSWLARMHMRFSPYHIYVKRAEKRLFENPRLRAVICNSNMVRAEILDHFKIDQSRIHVIYNGVDTRQFHPDIKRQKYRFREQWDIPDMVNVFVFIGSGYERKGLFQVLTAFKSVPENCYLLVAGYDKNEQFYREQAEHLGISLRVKFLGPQKDVIPCYAAADVFILPTLYDPFPNVVLEALACGLPVITSTKSGAAEVITDYVNGFVCNAYDLEKLQDAMRILSDREVAETMGKQARVVAEKYDLDKMAEDLTSLYKTLVIKP
ncbi:MAG: glycosyltransferase family 4 protein [Methylococcales bacterium]|nr:glycosyltransferase family 4 protein [Methylococcales bacterium]